MNIGLTNSQSLMFDRLRNIDPTNVNSLTLNRNREMQKALIFEQEGTDIERFFKARQKKLNEQNRYEVSATKLLKWIPNEISFSENTQEFFTHSCDGLLSRKMTSMSWKIRDFIQAYLEWNIYLNRIISLNPESMNEIFMRLIPQELLENGTPPPISGNIGYLFDTRLNSFDEIADRHYWYFNTVNIIDVEVSIWRLIFFALNSDPSGRSKNRGKYCLSFDEIKRKFVEGRTNRIKYIGLLSDKKIKLKSNYFLYKQEDEEKFIFLAESPKGQFFDKSSLKSFIEVPDENELNAIGSAIINDEFIHSLQIPKEIKDVLEKWKGEGISVSTAINKHINSQKTKKISTLQINCFLDFLPNFYGALSSSHVKLSPFRENNFIAQELPLEWCEDRYFKDELSAKYLMCQEQPVKYQKQIQKLNYFHLEHLAIRIFNFLEGTIPLSQIGITAQNASSVLIMTKIIDLTFFSKGFKKPLSSMIDFFSTKKIIKPYPWVNSSFSIRERVLEVGSIQLTTNEVFAKSLLPINFNDFGYLINPKNWIEESVGRQAIAIFQRHLCSRELSARIKEPVIFATRGNTGVGKSFWIKNQLIKIQHDANEKLIKGVLNPDSIKAFLKKTFSKPLLNSQVYAEGRMIFERLLEVFTKDIWNIKSDCGHKASKY